jgi:DNA-binding protein WhiA
MMTEAVKDELARMPVSQASARRAEIGTLLRFSGAVHLDEGRIVVEAELDTGSVARRLCREIAEIFGHTAQMDVVTGESIRSGIGYLVRVSDDGAGLARRAGLVDLRGRPVRGLPTRIVTGTKAEAEAAWRGAFLARGSLTEAGRTGSLDITCPSYKAALALVGAGRRLGVAAHTRETRGTDRVVIRDSEAIGVALARMGAHEGVTAWQERWTRDGAQATAKRLAHFDSSNSRRSALAAVAAAARVERAMEILGAEVPDHLLEPGRLRLEHMRSSLEELGARCEPVLTKDALAGRIRRLLALADNRAAAEGIPNTEAAVTAEMFAVRDSPGPYVADGQPRSA